MLNYPLVYWNLNQNKVLGILVGTSYKLVDSNIKKLKTKFSDKLKKDQDNGDYLEPPFKDYKLKKYIIEIQPTYIEKEGTFPTINNVSISIPVIFGEYQDNCYKAYLPLFDYSFYFYNDNQISNLVEHFVKDILKSRSPEDIYNYLLISNAQLETVSLKEKKYEYKELDFNDKYESLKILNNIAERLPTTSQRMKFSPQNAWEQSNTVSSLMKSIDGKENILIIGNQGVGKSTIILEAIKKLSIKNDNENPLSFWRTNSHRIISGSRYLGDWQQICENLIEELEYANGVLWITDFINLFTLGGSGSEDSVASFLQRFIEQKKLQIISEISPNELEVASRLLPNFTQRFQTININEIPQEKMLKIFSLFGDYSIKNFKIEIPKDSLELSYRLLDRYIKYENFPAKGINFLSKILSQSYFNEEKIVNKNDILEAFIEKTGLPSILVKDDELLDNEQLKYFFTSKIIDQNDAIEKMCSVIKIFKTGLNNPNKPISTILFAGPTGVGKTATTKVLAEYFFSKNQKKDPLIRLDMSEFQYPHQIERLIGAGKSEPSKFIQSIREKPFSVVLFDEIEKANPVIFDILLNILDEGRLIDSLGRITDFRNTIIIMTTNVGSEKSNSIGFNQNEENKNDKSHSKIKDFFRPEFFNRIDHIVVFNSLNKESIKKIVIKELADILQRDGIKNRNIKLEYSIDIINYLSENGFDKNYGARPLQRLIEREIISKLSKYLIENSDFKNSTLKIDFVDKDVLIVIEKKYY